MNNTSHQPAVYRLLRMFLRASVRIYFRKIEVEGSGRIPPSGPVVLVANHPNSVIDAFLLGTQLTHRTINFIAKDSIPNQPVIGPLLRKCGVIGVARRIDYGGELKQTHGKNLKAIDTCVPHLEAGEIVAIFGEGISTDRRKLGMIRKGAIRIAYDAEEQNGFRLGVTIVPVGINYSAKQKFRSEVLIRLAESFRITDLAADPVAEKPQLLLRGVRRLQASIEGSIVNLENEALGPLVDDISGFYLRDPSGGDGRSLDAHFSDQQRVVACAGYFNQTEPKRLQALSLQLQDYATLLRRLHMEDRAVAERFGFGDILRHLGQVAAEMALSLVTLYGWLNNLMPRYLGKFARRFGREREFTAATDGGTAERIVVARETLAAHYGGWAGAFVGYPVQIAAVGWVALANLSLPAGIGAAILYVLTLVPAWKFSLIHGERIRHHAGQLRLGLALMFRRLTHARVRRRRNAVVRSIEGLLHDYAGLRPAARP